MATTPTTPATLNLKLDMEKINQLLEAQPRINVTMQIAGQEHTIAEIVRVPRAGVTMADNNVNVLC